MDEALRRHLAVDGGQFCTSVPCSSQTLQSWLSFDMKSFRLNLNGSQHQTYSQHLQYLMTHTSHVQNNYQMSESSVNVPFYHKHLHWHFVLYAHQFISDNDY